MGGWIDIDQWIGEQSKPPGLLFHHQHTWSKRRWHQRKKSSARVVHDMDSWVVIVDGSEDGNGEVRARHSKATGHGGVRPSTFTSAHIHPPYTRCAPIDMHIHPTIRIPTYPP